ncbi:winged helix-turn-helix transcriptional regulator [Leuconostoc mesenteroides]|uniref:winged helix-turn-helix transcriptional regulator n=1 Tax=Leuconostoc mesenteroides TaxID=1245 RepID=UPI0009035F8B|nr:helix-turn-helix domain-containing protein [Leuconostoc mesenteroides]APE76681.1 MarR family transcriptional regulator [Leuconostoc mesenteroides subsp. jonggajibkimchii]
MLTANCPVQSTIDIVKGKFTVEILQAIHDGHNHYGMMKHRIPDINPRILATRIKDLESNGLITREHLPTNPPQIAYHLTDKALCLFKLVPEITNWYGDYQRQN